MLNKVPSCSYWSVEGYRVPLWGTGAGLTALARIVIAVNLGAAYNPPSQLQAGNQKVKVAQGNDMQYRVYHNPADTLHMILNNSRTQIYIINTTLTEPPRPHPRARRVLK